MNLCAVWMRLAVHFTLLLPLSACSQMYNWNQRIKLVIATPETVQAVEMIYHRFQINGFARSFFQRGEAMVADLGGGRYVFALLAAPYLAEVVLPDDIESRQWPRAFREIERREGSRFFDLGLNETKPRLVTFDDVTDPTTVRVLDKNDLAATLGAGYALVSMRIEITSDPITFGEVDEVLPWLAARVRAFTTEHY